MTEISPHKAFYQAAGSDPERLEIWCYCDRISYGVGDLVRLYVSTTADTYGLELYRDGDRPLPVFARDGLPGRHCETPLDCSVEGCGWPLAVEIEAGADWRSGAYVVRSFATNQRGETVEHHHIFILRPTLPLDGGRLLLVAATGTWTAYNDWGGSNHYEGITGPDGSLFAPRLSIQRPLARGFVTLPADAPRIPLREVPPRGVMPHYPHMVWAYENGFSKKYASAGWASYERPFVVWAERQGFAVDVISQHDLQYRPELLQGARCLCFVGHDEYWTWEMRDAVDHYVGQGGRVARFAGNFMWQTRLEDEGRTQVCYKYRAWAEDPLRAGPDHSRLTTSWEDPAVGRPGAASFGLNATKGLYVGWGGCVPRGSGGFTVYRPDHWAFGGSDLYYGDVFGGSSRIFGYEVDGLDYAMRDGLPYPSPDAGAPEGLEVLAMGLASTREENHGHPAEMLFINDEDQRFVAETLYGSADEAAMEKARRGNGMIVSFRRGRGEVLHAGSCEWVAGLIDRDVFVEQITRTVLERFLAK